MVVGSKEDLLTKDGGAIGWVDRVMVPFTPPACTSITGGAVARVAAVEVDGKGATGATVDGCRVSEAGVDIDSDKVPARVEGSLGQYWMKNMRSLLARIES